MALESALWQFLSKARVEIGNELHITRIENLCGDGTPDVEYYLGDGHARFYHHGTPISGQAWLELKSCERPARPATPIRFKLKDREAQIEWMRRRWCTGGNAYWLCQVGSGPDRILYMLRGDHGAKLKVGIIEAELAVLACTQGAVFMKPRACEVITRALVARNMRPPRKV